MSASDAAPVAQYLADRANASSAAEFPQDAERSSRAGLYAWWCSDSGLDVLSASFDRRLPPLIYAGQTGATSSRAGVERVATLASRIGGNHLSGNIGSSTFRQTLSAALREPLRLEGSGGRLDRESNSAVSAWMRTHLEIAIVPIDDRLTLANLEDDVLNILDPPLNLMGMPRSPVRSRLKELRKELRAATA